MLYVHSLLNIGIQCVIFRKARKGIFRERKAAKKKKKKSGLQNLMKIPKDRISVKVLSGIKPQLNSLFSVVKSIYIYICLNNIWLSIHITKEFKVYLITIWLIGAQLHIYQKAYTIMSFYSYYYFFNVKGVILSITNLHIVNKKNFQRECNAYIKCNNSASRVSRYKFYFHVKLSKQEHVI